MEQLSESDYEISLSRSVAVNDSFYLKNWNVYVGTVITNAFTGSDNLIRFSCVSNVCLFAFFKFMLTLN